MAGARGTAVKAAKDQAALAALLAGMPTGGGAWIKAARAAARTRLEAMGLPGRRDEYWRFTRPNALIAPPAPVPPIGGAGPFAGLKQLRVVFTDGVFDAAASDDLALAGVEITPLSTAAQADISWAQDIYGALETAGQKPVPRPFAALNTALARDGILIRATAKVERPIALIYNHVSETVDVVLHHVIRLEPQADLTLLESGTAGARLNGVIEVALGEGAALHHVRAQGPAPARQEITHVFARLAADSLLKSFTLAANGALIRNEAVVTFTGDTATAHIAGASIGTGNAGGFHHDDTVFVTHDARDCESRQVFKKVLRDGAVGVFQGKILVTPKAQKTDGYQMSQALMLDDDSQFLAKPELEIYADDVACSHGSTTGAIDEEALFYLRSRGVPRTMAEDLLVLAFLAQSLEEIDDPKIGEKLQELLQCWLERTS